MDTNGSGPGTIYGLWHEGMNLFSGYGIAVEPDRSDQLVGLLMVDRPQRVDPQWLGLIEIMFGTLSLHQMTHDGALGIACQMYISEESQQYIKSFPEESMPAFRAALQPLLDELPKVQLELRWNAQERLWGSRFRINPDGSNPGQPRFLLGDIVATPGATIALIESSISPKDLLRRHVTGDWGELDPADVQENEHSVIHGYRILSRYVLESRTVLWIITEHDRSVTTLLLPSEY